MTDAQPRFSYPRRRLIRTALHELSKVAFRLLTHAEIVGEENLPRSGPLILVGNHFSYIDPVAFVRIARWPIEFIGGFVNPGAPRSVRVIPRLWGYYPVFRGTGSTYALKAAEATLKQNGVLGIFPEAGNWATVLRPARPGTAFIAARTGAPLIPVGLDGLTEVFPALHERRRARVTIRIGKPFGPFAVSGRGRERREQLDRIGHEIMARVAELIPPERRGHYSEDPAIREAARGTEIYPWADAVETDFTSGEHL